MRYVQVLVPDSVLWGLSNRFWVSDILTPTFLGVLRFREVPLVEPSIQASDSTPGCDPTKFGVTFFFSLCVSSWKEYIKIKSKFSQKNRYISFIILCVFLALVKVISPERKKPIWVGPGHERDCAALANSG